MERSQLEHYLATASDPALMVAALVVAFFLGAAHALTPGHGKTIVGAYLAGSRGRILDAVYLGGVVTVTHTASVFLIGLITLYVSRSVSLDRIFPWMSLASGLLIAVIGAWLLYVRLFASGGGEAHSHEPPSRGSLLSLGISGGLVPCPEALVVLMLSITLRRLLFGMAMLTAFSLGLASVLIAIGIGMVMMGPAVRKMSGSAPWLDRLPALSALVVTLLGVVLVVQAIGKF
ncbi:MAG: hypothetical protein U0Q16_07955 [Bryobacteraceae bacterium]